MQLMVVDPFYVKDGGFGDGQIISTPSFERNSIKSSIIITTSSSLEEIILNNDDNDYGSKFTNRNALGFLWSIRPIKEKIIYLTSIYSESGLFSIIDPFNFSGFDWISLITKNEKPLNIIFCDKIELLYTMNHIPPQNDDGWLEHGSFSIWIEGNLDSVDNIILSPLKH